MTTSDTIEAAREAIGDLALVVVATSGAIPLLGLWYLHGIAVALDRWLDIVAWTGWPYAVYAMAVIIMRRRWATWHAGPSVISGIALLASQAYVWVRVLATPEGASGVGVAAGLGLLPLLQVTVILPAGIAIGLLLHGAARLVPRLVRGPSRT